MSSSQPSVAEFFTRLTSHPTWQNNIAQLRSLRKQINWISGVNTVASILLQIALYSLPAAFGEGSTQVGQFVVLMVSITLYSIYLLSIIYLHYLVGYPISQILQHLANTLGDRSARLVFGLGAAFMWTMVLVIGATVALLSIVVSVDNWFVYGIFVTFAELLALLIPVVVFVHAVSFGALQSSQQQVSVAVAAAQSASSPRLETAMELSNVPMIGTAEAEDDEEEDQIGGKGMLEAEEEGEIELVEEGRSTSQDGEV